MVHSDPKTLNQVVNDKRIEIHGSKGIDPEYELKQKAIEAIVPLKTSPGGSVGSYKRAVDNAYDGGKKSDITVACNEAKRLLAEIAKKLDVAGVEPKDWVRPNSVVLNAIDEGTIWGTQTTVYSDIAALFGEVVLFGVQVLLE